jgi:hypothetical protein
MPEIVWQFFEPPSVLIEDMSQEEIRRMNETADFNRWNFFLALKNMARDDQAETKVIFCYCV